MVGGSQPKPKDSSLVQGTALEELKAYVDNFNKLDEEARFRAESYFANALYNKFLGKAPPLDLVKSVLLEKWKSWGEVHIADLPNGYFLIQ